MRRLVLSADYLDFSILDDASVEIDRTEVPTELIEALTAWNADYQVIIPLSASERSAEGFSNAISRLDHKGKELANSLASGLVDVDEVRYYSEGKLAYLP